MRLNLAKKFVARGYEVEIVVGKRVGSLDASLPEGIRVIEISPKGPAWYFYGLLGYLARRSPEYILSSYEDISAMAIVANWLCGSRSSVAVSTHNAISKLKYEGNLRKRMKYRFLLRVLGFLYRRTYSLVAVSYGVARDVSETLNIPISEIRVIYNPVISEDFELLSKADLPAAAVKLANVPLVGYFGRLHKQKRVDRLIRAFAVVRENIRCTLIVVGEGEEEANLRALVAELNLISDVVFWGQIDNPFPLMKHCETIVLPSDYEGLGNVLIEALGIGVQVISTDCPYGPSEILEGGKWGQLVPVGDIEAMANAITRSLEKDFWVAPEKLKERGFVFSTDTAADRYLEVLGLNPWSAHQ